MDNNEIAKFKDPEYWLKFFPALAVDDLRKLGVKVGFMYFSRLYFISGAVFIFNKPYSLYFMYVSGIRTYQLYLFI